MEEGEKDKGEEVVGEEDMQREEELERRGRSEEKPPTAEEVEEEEEMESAKMVVVVGDTGIGWNTMWIVKGQVVLLGGGDSGGDPQTTEAVVAVALAVVSCIYGAVGKRPCWPPACGF